MIKLTKERLKIVPDDRLFDEKMDCLFSGNKERVTHTSVERGTRSY